MRKESTNYFAYNVIKRQAASGSLSIFELSQNEDPDKRLIFFVEIESSDKDNETITELLTDELEKQFFNAPTENIEYAFENALAKANIKVKDILLSKPKNWLNKIHIIVAAIEHEEVHVASVGNMHAFLIYQDKATDILETNTSITTPNPVKLFSNITSGKLSLGNSIVLTNESVLDYISVERIRKFAKEFSPNETIAKLTELLERAPTNKQFGISAFKRSPEHVQSQEDIPYEKESEQWKDPDEYLKPENTEKFEKDIASSKAVQQKIIKVLKKYSGSGLTLILAGFSKALEKSQYGLSKLLSGISKLPSLIKLVWKNRDARNYHLSKILGSTKNKSEQTKSNTLNQWAKIPKKQKTVILAIIGLAIIFVGSIAIRTQDKIQETTQENLEIDVSAVEQKINEAEAALIYKNDSGARQFLGEAQSLLDNLVRESSGSEEKFQELEQKIIDLKDKSEKKNKLTNLEPLVTIIPSPITTKETGFILINDSLFYFDGVAEKVALVDIDNGLLLTLPLENQGIESFNTAVVLTESSIAALSKDKVLIIDVEDEVINKQRFDFNPSSAQAFASYAKNLYTFPPTKDDIIRYKRAGLGFTTAQRWLIEEYDLSNMVDIKVDGFIYTLRNNGDIHVFLKGEFNKIISFPTNNQPGDGISFYTNEEIDTFFILDPQNKRIVHMTKTGDLIFQYIADEFANANDVVVNNDESMMYVLVSDKIFQIPIE